MSTNESVTDYIEQIVAALSGEPIAKVILFGSAASGRMGIDSDLDLLIVMDTDYALRQALPRGRRQ